MRPRSEAGFSFLELLIVVSVLVPVLFSVLGTGTLVGNSVDTIDRNAEVRETLRTVGQRLASLFRSGVLSTCRVTATKADVLERQLEADLAIAVDPTDIRYVPTVGEWISPQELDPRDNLHMQCADGELSMNADALSSAYEFEVEAEAGEVMNGVDDDDDGIVDEMQLLLTYGGGKVALASGVEFVSFHLEGPVIEFTLRCVRRDRQGRLHRAGLRRRVFMRNN